MSDQQSGRGLYWLATIAAAITLLLSIANIILIVNNQSLQQQASAKQQNVNGTLQLLQINRALAISLANHGVANKDQAVIDMLQRHGIKVSVKTEDEAPAANGKK